MRRLEEEKLDNIMGGATTMNGPLINAIVNIVEVLREAGISIGSGIRRISEGKICPLE